MKKVFAIILSAALAAALGACSPTTEQTQTAAQTGEMEMPEVP